MSKGYVTLQRTLRNRECVLCEDQGHTENYERDWCVVLRGLGDGRDEGLLRF